MFSPQTFIPSKFVQSFPDLHVHVNDKRKYVPFPILLQGKTCKK